MVKELEVDSMTVENVSAGPHAQTDGQVRNITPPLAISFGFGYGRNRKKTLSVETRTVGAQSVHVLPVTTNEGPTG